jgi:hypothetical protein
MALWVPQVVLFVIRLDRLMNRLSIPDCLFAITPRSTSRLPRLTPAETSRVIWNVLRWNRGPFNHGCFVRSFTRYHFLRKMSTPAVFHLGVESREVSSSDGGEPREDGPAAYLHLRSHAWLSLRGEPLLESEPETCRSYREIYRFPPEDHEA